MRRVLERLLNLLVFLRTAHRPTSADTIRFTVAGYDVENDAAFRRMFERDKEMLRSMGIPLSTVDMGDGAVGYLLESTEYEMPDPGLTEEERAALWLASRIAGMGGFGSSDDALYKLGGADDRPQATVGADLGTERAALGLLFGAIGDRTSVTFRHREKARRMDPYGILHQRGHWYLIGRTGDGVRSFRVDRATDWHREGRSGSFDRPPDLDLRAAVPLHPWVPGDEDVVATVRFDEGVRWWAQRQVPDATWRDVDGGVEADLPTGNTQALISWVLEFGPQAELLAPAAARAALVARVSGG